MEEHIGYLSKNQAIKLLEKFASSNVNVTNDDCMRVLQWASKAKMENDLLDMVMEGKIIVSLSDTKELMFSSPAPGVITPAVTSRSQPSPAGAPPSYPSARGCS